MLANRLMAGTALAVACALMLFLDAQLAPYYPVLWLVALVTGTLSTREMVRLLPADCRPPTTFITLGVLAILTANWAQAFSTVDPWHPVTFTLSAVLLGVLLIELASTEGPGRHGARAGGAALIVIYLGLLPSFLLRLRWLDAAPHHTAALVAAPIIAAKGCDIGAYTVGRLIGRTPLAPKLSPKKTREGLLGGLVFAAGAVAGLHDAHPIFRGGFLEAALFGIIVGAAGVLGDLTESMFKRDVQTKDAAATIPGFGGVLDVLDSLLFAGPVAYVWLTLRHG